MKFTYDRGVLLVQVPIMLLDALLTAEKDIAIAKILILPFDGTAHGNPLHLIRGIVRVLSVLWIGSLRFMTNKAKSIDLDLFTLDKSC